MSENKSKKTPKEIIIERIMEGIKNHEGKGYVFIYLSDKASVFANTNFAEVRINLDKKTSITSTLCRKEDDE